MLFVVLCACMEFNNGKGSNVGDLHKSFTQAELVRVLNNSEAVKGLLDLMRQCFFDVAGVKEKEERLEERFLDAFKRLVIERRAYLGTFSNGEAVGNVTDIPDIPEKEWNQIITGMRKDLRRIVNMSDISRQGAWKEMLGIVTFAKRVSEGNDVYSAPTPSLKNPFVSLMTYMHAVVNDGPIPGVPRTVKKRYSLKSAALGAGFAALTTSAFVASVVSTGSGLSLAAAKSLGMSPASLQMYFVGASALVSAGIFYSADKISRAFARGTEAKRRHVVLNKALRTISLVGALTAAGGVVYTAGDTMRSAENAVSVVKPYKDEVQRLVKSAKDIEQSVSEAYSSAKIAEIKNPDRPGFGPLATAIALLSGDSEDDIKTSIREFVESKRANSMSDEDDDVEDRVNDIYDKGKEKRDAVLNELRKKDIESDSLHGYITGKMREAGFDVQADSLDDLLQKIQGYGAFTLTDFIKSIFDPIEGIPTQETMVQARKDLAGKIRELKQSREGFVNDMHKLKSALEDVDRNTGVNLVPFVEKILQGLPELQFSEDDLSRLENGSTIDINKSGGFVRWLDNAIDSVLKAPEVIAHELNTLGDKPDGEMRYYQRIFKGETKGELYANTIKWFLLLGLLVFSVDGMRLWLGKRVERTRKEWQDKLNAETQQDVVRAINELTIQISHNINAVLKPLLDVQVNQNNKYWFDRYNLAVAVRMLIEDRMRDESGEITPDSVNKFLKYYKKNGRDVVALEIADELYPGIKGALAYYAQARRKNSIIRKVLNSGNRYDTTHPEPNADASFEVLSERVRNLLHRAEIEKISKGESIRLGEGGLSDGECAELVASTPSLSDKHKSMLALYGLIERMRGVYGESFQKLSDLLPAISEGDRFIDLRKRLIDGMREYVREIHDALASTSNNSAYSIHIINDPSGIRGSKTLYIEVLGDNDKSPILRGFGGGTLGFIIPKSVFSFGESFRFSNANNDLHYHLTEDEKSVLRKIGEYISEQVVPVLRAYSVAEKNVESFKDGTVLSSVEHTELQSYFMAGASYMLLPDFRKFYESITESIEYIARSTDTSFTNYFDTFSNDFNKYLDYMKNTYENIQNSLQKIKRSAVVYLVKDNKRNKVRFEVENKELVPPENKTVIHIDDSKQNIQRKINNLFGVFDESDQKKVEGPDSTAINPFK